MSEWKKVKLGEIADFQKGFAFKSKDYQSEGRKIIKVSNTTSNSIDISSCVCIDEEKATNYEKYVLCENDAIIATVGSWPNNPNSVVGKVVKVPATAENSLLNQNAVRVRSNGLTTQNFLNYTLFNKGFSHYIVGTAQGSASQASITQNDIKDYSVNLPPIPTQRKIAAILSSLDEKIENNRKTCEKLEEIAQAIFKRWFVDFEFLNEEGKPYKSSGGKMVESELGLIPEGWDVVSLLDSVDLFDSKRIPLSKIQREKRKGNIPYYGATSIMAYVDEPIFSGDHILMAEDGSVMDEQGYPVIQYVWGDFWVNNHAHIMKGKLVSNGFLYFLLKQMKVSEVVTGAVQLKISQTAMRKLNFVLPKSTEYDFNTALDSIKSLRIQNNCLKETRDTLLPKLMSGEVSVEDLEHKDV